LHGLAQAFGQMQQEVEHVLDLGPAAWPMPTGNARGEHLIEAGSLWAARVTRL